MMLVDRLLEVRRTAYAGCSDDELPENQKLLVEAAAELVRYEQTCRMVVDRLDNIEQILARVLKGPLHY